MLKAPETKRLKLTYYNLLPNFQFKFNLRRYTVWSKKEGDDDEQAGAYTRSRFRST